MHDILFATGGRYDVQAPQPAAIRDFFERHPSIRLKIWSGLPMPAGARGASLSLAMAADLGPDIFEADIRQSVAQGFAYPLTERIGFPDYIRLMPPENRRLWERVESGDIRLMTEPFTGRWLQFRDYLQREAIDLTLGSYGRTFDYAGAPKIAD